MRGGYISSPIASVLGSLSRNSSWSSFFRSNKWTILAVFVVVSTAIGVLVYVFTKPVIYGDPLSDSEIKTCSGDTITGRAKATINTYVVFDQVVTNRVGKVSARKCVTGNFKNGPSPACEGGNINSVENDSSLNGSPRFIFCDNTWASKGSHEVYKY